MLSAVKRNPLAILAAAVATLVDAVGRLVVRAGSAASTLRRIPANAVDRALDLLGLIRDVAIQLELEFAERLDAGRLSRALDLILDAEPVLGCRLVRHWRRPYWERVEPSRRAVFQVASNPQALEAFKLRRLDISRRPPIEACLHRSAAGDRLVLKIDHHVTDVGGLLELAALLSKTYRRLARDPGYRPRPNPEGSRSMRQVFRRIPLRALPEIVVGFLRTVGSFLWHQRSVTLPLETGPATGAAFVSRTIPIAQVARIAGYGRARSATINDVMLAAFFRALAAVGRRDGRSQLRAVTTVSHRRYLPGGRGEAITNLCGMEYPSLGTDPGRDLAETLERVTRITRRRKASWPGLSDYVGLAPLFLSGLPQSLVLKLGRAVVRRGTRAGSIPHSLSNVGRIDPTGLVMDGATPIGARILPGSSRPPHLFTCLSGYQGTLYIAACVFEPQRVQVERFFDRLIYELPGAAGDRQGDES